MKKLKKWPASVRTFQINNHPIGEKSPSLVTLLSTLEKKGP
jgi:hypothetical protein